MIFGDKGMKVAMGKGTIKIKLSKYHQLIFHSVYYVPGLAKHMLSVGQATIDGLPIQLCFDKSILQFQDGSSSIQMVSPKEHYLYPVHNSIIICINFTCKNKKPISLIN